MALLHVEGSHLLLVESSEKLAVGERKEEAVAKDDGLRREGDSP